MTTLSIKIVGTEGDSVLVKFASENSAKPIDDYEAIAYQPRVMGYTDMNEFIEAIKPGLLVQVIARDKEESAPEELDISSWAGHVSEHVQQETLVEPPLDSQLLVKESEVIL
jgi:hypothetical protein